MTEKQPRDYIREGFEFNVLYPEEAIRKRVEELGQEITKDYEDEEAVILIGGLKGAFIFLADLAREIDHPGLMVEFMGASSYGNETTSSKEPNIYLNINPALIEGMHVILVEDLIDEGHSIEAFKKAIQACNPKSLKVCVFVVKPEQEVDVKADYVGFQMKKNDWIEGYGPDSNELGRNRKNIVIVKSPTS